MYELLERLGCRLFTADCEKVPYVTELVLDELDEAHPKYFAMDENGVRVLTLHKNQLCSIECCFAHSFEGVQSRRT